MDKEWFAGTILSYGETTGTAFVKYDDNEEENLHLIMERFRLITGRETNNVSSWLVLWQTLILRLRACNAGFYHRHSVSAFVVLVERIGRSHSLPLT